MLNNTELIKCNLPAKNRLLEIQLSIQAVIFSGRGLQYVKDNFPVINGTPRYLTRRVPILNAKICYNYAASLSESPEQ